jgi:hypothetical protein
MQDFLLDIATLLPGKLEILSHTFRNHLRIMGVRQAKLTQLVNKALEVCVEVKEDPTPENVMRVYALLLQIQKSSADVGAEFGYWRTEVMSLGDVATEATVIPPLAERFRFVVERLPGVVEGKLLEDENG